MRPAVDRPSAIIRCEFPWSGSIQAGEFHLRREVRHDGHYWLLSTAIAWQLEIRDPEALVLLGKTLEAWLLRLDRERVRSHEGEGA